MKNSSDGFFIGRVKSFRYDVKGAYLILTTEHSVITQFSLAILSVFIGLMVGITKTEWLFQILSIGLILSIEGLNTAVEKLCDFVHPAYHKKVGFIKDIAAGAVTFAALTSLSIITVIYFPYIYEKVY